MKKYSILHIPILSFFSKSLYRDVGLHWKGTGFGYLLLLFTVCSLFSVASYRHDIKKINDDEILPNLSQWPTVRIVDSKASADVMQPFYIKDVKSGRMLAVIDTTGTINSLNQTDARILLTKTEVIGGVSETKSHTISFAGVDDLTVDQRKIEEWINIYLDLCLTLLYPLCVLLYLVKGIVQALICAALGKLVANWFKVRLSYVALIRLSVSAMTPMIIVTTVLSSAWNVNLPVERLWYVVATIIYLVFALMACAQAQRHSQLSEGIQRMEYVCR